jgi:hypothetical protein
LNQTIDDPDLLLTCYELKAFKPGDKILCRGCRANHVVLGWQGSTLMVNVSDLPTVPDAIAAKDVAAWTRTEEEK